MISLPYIVVIYMHVYIDVYTSKLMPEEWEFTTWILMGIKKTGLMH